MNCYIEEDINIFVQDFSDSDRFINSHVLVTGGTGLIGSILVRCLLGLDVNVRITLPVRSILKAEAIYERDMEKLDVVECNLLDWTGNMSGEYDYIIHCASPTAGIYMSEHPVETYQLAVLSTLNILEYCRHSNVKGFVYVSSLEYYGQIFEDKEINENMLGFVDMNDTRSCYPIGKRSAEYACTMYAKEYNVPVRIARLTQTLGAGISESDKRVFAQFARSVINGDDIILHTEGKSAKPYLYTTDCVNAILLLLWKGKNGEAYNVANQDTYISIRELAEFLRENFNTNISVRVELHTEMGYAPITKLRLSSEKLMTLGWKPRYDLREMFEKLINSMR